MVCPRVVGPTEVSISLEQYKSHSREEDWEARVDVHLCFVYILTKGFSCPPALPHAVALNGRTKFNFWASRPRSGVDRAVKARIDVMTKTQVNGDGLGSELLSPQMEEEGLMREGPMNVGRARGHQRMAEVCCIIHSKPCLRSAKQPPMQYCMNRALFRSYLTILTLNRRANFRRCPRRAF